MIRVLLVDDSEVSLMILEHILQKEPDIAVIGKARDGNEALQLVSSLSPDLVTMDIHMPGQDGFSTTRMIMERTPVPIIIVSGVEDLDEIRASFSAVKAGALAVFRKPPARDDPEYDHLVQELVSAIRIFSEVKVIRRRSLQASKREHSGLVLPFMPEICPDIRIVVMGASTGGPQAVQEILANLPLDYPLPVVLVQHMSPGFIDGFGVWLNESTHFTTRIPEDGELLKPGILYLAPDGRHSGINREMRIVFSDGMPEHNLRPSVSYLFRSVACSMGKNTLGILLTGMGTDGAEELLRIKQQGGCTIIQDQESSFIYGMPGAAAGLDAAMFSLSPRDIAGFMVKIGGKSGYGR